MLGDQIKGKRVPWSHMEDYLALHQKSLVSMIDLVTMNVIDVTDAETRLPTTFF